MPKVVSALELPLQPKAPGVTLADWLSAEIVAAIRDGRLQPGTRLPATRDLAQQYRVARGTVIAVFDRLRTEGLIATRVGAGTWVANEASNRPMVGAARRSPQSRDNAPPSSGRFVRMNRQSKRSPSVSGRGSRRVAGSA